MHFKSVNLVVTNSSVRYIILHTNSKNIRKCSLYLYNDRFYLLLNTVPNAILCEKKTGSLSIAPSLSTSEFLGMGSVFRNLAISINKLSTVMYSWDSYFFNKLTIDGKAYRINKLRGNNFKLMFGRSHMCLLYYKNVFLKKKKKIKKKFMFYGSSKYHVDSTASTTKLVRPNDVFTDRGIRFSKQINNRKLGKKGSTSVI